MATTRKLPAAPLRRTNLADVAKSAGVAVSTVSRVMNGFTTGFSVKPEIRQRILDAAKRLHYRPNFVARNLSAKRTNLVAVLGQRMFAATTPGVNEVAIEHVTHTLNNAGYGVCSNFMRTGDPHQLPAWRVDGIVVVYSERFNGFEELESIGMPYVCINGPTGEHGSNVLVDDAAGTRLAMEHLLDLGHRNIALAMPPKETMPHSSMTDRLATYEAIIRERGLPSIVRHVQWTDAEVLRPTAIPILAFLNELAGDTITAVLAYDHIMAVSLQKVAHLRGLRIPHHFSLSCFNDEFPCQFTSPSLTAVRLPSAEMGVTAATLLLERMNRVEATEPSRIVLPEELVVRESTVPVNK